MVRSMVLCLAVLVCSSSFAPLMAQDDSDLRTAELKWSRGVALDFLDAAFDCECEQAEALIDDSLKAVYATDGPHALEEWLNNQIGIQGFEKPVIETEEMAPDKDEASFRGTFQDEDVTYRFSLRVVKVKDSGLWRVGFFSFAVKPPTGK